MRAIQVTILLALLTLVACNGVPPPEPHGAVGAAAASGLSANVNPESGQHAGSGSH